MKTTIHSSTTNARKLDVEASEYGDKHVNLTFIDTTTTATGPARTVSFRKAQLVDAIARADLGPEDPAPASPLEQLLEKAEAEAELIKSAMTALSAFVAPNDYVELNTVESAARWLRAQLEKETKA